MRRFAAEFIGTMVLVIMGCGTAMLVGCGMEQGCGYALTAMAFGIAAAAMVYCTGNISGCHINPAVSLSMLMNGRMSGKRFAGYVTAQILGALSGTGVLTLIFTSGLIPDMTAAGGAAYSFASNGLKGVNDSRAAGLLAEIVLTFIFVITVLSTAKNEGNRVGSAVITGLALTLVHILGIGLTGTSVNPARSLAPSVAALISGNREPISCLWIFIAGPFVGSALAAFVYKYLSADNG